jgi:hypothetical protein
VSGPSDTEPSPPPSGIAAEIVEAAADDVADVLAAIRVQVGNLEAIQSLLRREAAEAKQR